MLSAAEGFKNRYNNIVMDGTVLLLTLGILLNLLVLAGIIRLSDATDRCRAQIQLNRNRWIAQIQQFRRNLRQTDQVLAGLEHGAATVIKPPATVRGKLFRVVLRYLVR